MDKDTKVKEYTDFVFETPYNHPYFSPTPGKLTIGALTPTETNAIPDVTLCNTLANAGFNAAVLAFDQYDPLTVHYKPALLKTIENCRNAGITPFITGKVLLRRGATRNDFIDDCLSDEGFGGWWLPTPDYNLWSDGKAGIDPYNYIWNRAITIDPNNQRMVVAPVYPSLKNTDAPDYGAYVNRFQTKIGPSVWLFGIDGSDDDTIDETGIEKELSFLYRDCQIYSFLAQYCWRPLWFIVKDSSTVGAVEKDKAMILYPETTLIRLRAFTALAYGAQGLLYDIELRNSSTLDCITTLNKELRWLDRVFHDAELVQVRHVGKKQYYGTSMLRGAFGPIISIQTGDKGIVLSHLNNQGTDYVVIVSRSIGEEGNTPQQLDIRFSIDFTITRIWLNESQMPQESLISDRDFSYSLPCGEYLIFRWVRTV